jgi:hypothetical protein
VFDPVQVNQDRPRRDAYRIIVAELTGAAQRHARWRELTESKTADAVAELREIAGGRADLLAEVAGLLLGAREGALDEAKAKAAAQLCRLEGADESVIPKWIEEGHRHDHDPQAGPPPGRHTTPAALGRRSRRPPRSTGPGRLTCFIYRL